MKELEIFYKLLENTNYDNISVEYGCNTKKITNCTIPNTSLKVSYGSIKTTYEICYKGVLMVEAEIKEEDAINHKIRNIIDTKKSEIIKEYNEIT